VMWHPSTINGFILTDCVFSGSLPSSNIIAALNNVKTNTVTASLDLGYYSTCFHPSSRPFTPSSGLTGSSRFAPSEWIHPTVRVDTTPFLDPSHSAAASSRFNGSPTFAATDWFRQRARLGPTDPIEFGARRRRLHFLLMGVFLIPIDDAFW
jgi:hypothetical protein